MNDEDYLPISAVERFAFCQRQAYLFHVERAFADNRFTVEGSLLHERVTSGEEEHRGGLHTVRSLRIVCHRLGLVGEADVVEIRAGQPSPVEYKRGKRTRRHCEQAQLCAQALCLEEMFGVEIPEGYVYHGGSRRREPVVLSPQLRGETEALIEALRAMLASPSAPRAVEAPHCTSCSLREHCQPHATREGVSVANYLSRNLR